MKMRTICAVVVLTAGAAVMSAQRAKQVILISIDGMTTVDYLHANEHGLKIPALRALMAEGCPANGMTGIFPTVTYPSHTAMITGQPSAVHGIISNTPLDPFGWENGGWYYYADQITAPTLWQVLHKAGVTTAAVSWPVTVGADVDWLLPEYRPVRTPEDASLMRALSTRRLFAEAEKNDPADRPMSDAWRIRAAEMILREHHPGLLALHISNLDEAQHRFGPHSVEAHKTLEAIDAELGELRAAVAANGDAASTAWVIVSDHGFLPVERFVQPLTVLHDAGLIATDAAGKITAWKIYARNSTGSIFFEAHDPNDHENIAKATELLTKLAADPANGVAHVDTPEDLQAEHADPKAFLAFKAARGFGFGMNLTGPLLTPANEKGAHGYDPAYSELRPSMILAGAGVSRCTLREGVKITDVGPTVAALLGVTMSGAQGHDVNEAGSRK